MTGYTPGCRMVYKPWGSEEVIAQTPHYLGKILRVNRGHRLSSQYHKKKTETMYCLSGRAILEIGGETQILDPGQNVTIPATTQHRLSARLSDIVIIEVSTPDYDDVVRLEDDYGRVEHGKEADGGQEADREAAKEADPEADSLNDGSESMGNLQGEGKK